MELDLTNRVEGVPERFDPASMRGELTEGEHLVRYAWAARLARERRVLDAGCGLGYGSRMLAEAGAAEVVGVDVAEAVVEAARAADEQGLQLVTGDVRDLDFEDDRFDLVVCFEVIEHVQEGRRVIGELARVLAPGGLLLVSSPNPEAYVPGNPHHVHEYRPGELRAALAESFEHVALWRQHNWICSAVLDDEAFAADALEEVPGMWVRKVAGEIPGRETYTLALATNARLPETTPGAVMTGAAEVRKWLELYHEQAEILRGQHEYFQDLEDRRAELGELRRQLAEAERALSRLPSVEQQRDEAVAARDEAVRRAEELSARAESGERVLTAVMSSPSWRVTSPLRSLKRGLKRAWK